MENEPIECHIEALTLNESTDKLSPQLSKWVKKEKVNEIAIYAQKTSINSDILSIDHVPREVYSIFPNLRKLTIKSKIKEVVAEDFFTSANRSDLILINLSGNQLTIIRRDTFGGIFTLEKLNLNDNDIHTIENGSFSDLTNLKVLLMSGNKIKVLDDRAFYGITALVHLDLSHNGITNIGNSFDVLSSVEKLILRSNEINYTEIAKFTKLPKLKELDLSRAIVNSPTDSKESKPSWLQQFTIGVLQMFRIIPDSADSTDLNSNCILYSHLNVLDLGSNDFIIESVVEILPIFPELKEMNLGENKFDQSNTIIDEIKQNRSMRIYFSSFGIYSKLVN